jgi:fatty acid amide hydrolase
MTKLALAVGNAASPLTAWSAAELARRIAAGEVSAREVVEAHIARIEAVNPQLNAVCVSLFEQARAAAERADAVQARGEPLGPLHGVPLTVKECFHVAGTASTMGLAARRDRLEPRDGPLVARLRAAGAIVLGKTNVPQLMVLHETDNPLYGRTNNPWNLDRTPGGSSGGEAAIIAAHGSPLGIGSDLGGSIRIPAHFCGIYGFKPTSYRLTKLGLATNLHGMEAVQFQPGPLARRVEDLELAMRVLVDAPPIAGDFETPPVAWREPGAVDVGRLRVAVWLGDDYLAPCKAIERVVRDAAAALAAAGATVEYIDFPNLPEALRLYLALAGADGGRDFRRLVAGSKVDPRIARMIRLAGAPRWLRPLGAWWLNVRGQRKLAELFANAGPRTADGYWQLTYRAAEFTRAFLAQLAAQHFDAIICPPHTLPAVLHGEADADLLPAAGHQLLLNLLGVPCGVVPAGRVEADDLAVERAVHDALTGRCRRNERGSVGLPVGVQVAAPHWRDDIVLAVMQQLERHFGRV